MWFFFFFFFFFFWGGVKRESERERGDREIVEKETDSVRDKGRD